MIVTEGSEPLQAGRLPGIAARIGAAGGFVTDQLPCSITEVTGSYGGWKSARWYWNSTGHAPEVGTLTASLAFETTPVADYLYRVAVPGHPEVNRMFTDLDMAGGGTRHNITGAQDISTVSVTASGTVSAGDDLAAADDLTVGDDAMIGDRLTVNGQSAFARDASFGEDVSVTGNGTIGGTLDVTGETTSADFRIASMGGQRVSAAIYYVGIHQHNDSVTKPTCPGGMSPQVFVSPAVFSDAGTGRTISAVRCGPPLPRRQGSPGRARWPRPRSKNRSCGIPFRSGAATESLGRTRSSAERWQFDRFKLPKVVMLAFRLY